MSLPKHDAEMLSARWIEGVLLKRDVFSTVERGRFRGDGGEVDAVLRRLDQVPWWSLVLARHLFARERDALALAKGLDVGPELFWAGRRVLVRGFIDGVALHLAKPYEDRAYFRSAKAALRRLHRAGICHNDLAKEQNWLRGSNGRAYLTDFQLAICFPRRGRLFRILAYEDLRHLLKHKHRYLQDAFTATDWRLRGRKSGITRSWMATGKQLYNWIVHGVFRLADVEGGGPRLLHDAPRIAASLKQHPQVRDVAVVGFYDRGAKNSLYAFVEAEPGLSEPAMRDFIAQSVADAEPPECIQLVDGLPRRHTGEIRVELLQLVASNQLDQIDDLLAGEPERAILGAIIAHRRNLADRF
jgi:AMP-binding enzyme C-terminal domain